MQRILNQAEQGIRLIAQIAHLQAERGKQRAFWPTIIATATAGLGLITHAFGRDLGINPDTAVGLETAFGAVAVTCSVIVYYEHHKRSGPTSPY